METVNQRIKFFIDQKKLNVSSFAKIIGSSQPTLATICKGTFNPSFDILMSIFESFPELSKDWLLEGKGEMYKNKSLENNEFLEFLKLNNQSLVENNKLLLEDKKILQTEKERLWSVIQKNGYAVNFRKEEQQSATKGFVKLLRPKSIEEQEEKKLA